MQSFNALQYLKIDIASAFGLDKLTWNQRIAWFDENTDNMGDLVTQAKEPAMFYAGCKAYNDALAGKPSGYMISLDATSSGLQLLACLTGDRKAAELCNVINYKSPEAILEFGEDAENERRDGYTVIYNKMLEAVGEEGKISRDKTKEAIMTSLYSSTAMPKKIFGEGALLDTFYATMHEVAPAAWELKDAMMAFWNPEALSHDWVLPDNFHVKVKVMDSVKETVFFENEPFDVFHKVNRPQDEGRSLGANTIHSIDGMIVREMTRRCDYNVKQVNYLYDLMAEPVVYGKSTGRDNDKLVLALWGHYDRCGYLSARILDVLDADNLGHVDVGVIWELLNSLPQKPFKVVSIHDCFRCHPNYGNDLRIQYARQLMEIAKSELLSYIISQLLGRVVQVGKDHPELWTEIIDTDYALS